MKTDLQSRQERLSYKGAIRKGQVFIRSRRANHKLSYPMLLLKVQRTVLEPSLSVCLSHHECTKACYRKLQAKKSF